MEAVLAERSLFCWHLIHHFRNHKAYPSSLVDVVVSGGRVLKYEDLFVLKYSFVKRILLLRKVADVIVSQPVKACSMRE